MFKVLQLDKTKENERNRVLCFLSPRATALQAIQKCHHIVDLGLLGGARHQLDLLRELTKLKVLVGPAKIDGIGALRVDRLQLARSRLADQVAGN